MAKGNANNQGATLLDEAREDFYRPRTAEPEARAPRPLRAASDAEADAEEPFLRSRRRVPVRRGLLPAWAKTRWGRVLFAGILLMTLGAVAATLLATRNFLEHDARFRIESAASIQTVGMNHLSRADLLSVFGGDIGHNIFRVQLGQRQVELEQLPWVRTATVMRLLPDQIRVSVTERMPVAFVQVHGRIELADAAGMILDMAPQEMATKHYSFPVVSGINPGDPLSVRGARMQLYQQFIGALDSTGEHFSSQISEVNLSDPEDVRATVPASGTDLVLHFGQQDFLERWRNYQAHIAEWRQQYPNLASVDLRYDHEVVLKMAGSAQDDSAKPAAATRPSSNPPHKSVAHKAQNTKHGHATDRAHHTHRRAP